MQRLQPVNRPPAEAAPCWRKKAQSKLFPSRPAVVSAERRPGGTAGQQRGNLSRTLAAFSPSAAVQGRLGKVGGEGRLTMWNQAESLLLLLLVLQANQVPGVVFFSLR